MMLKKQLILNTNPTSRGYQYSLKCLEKIKNKINTRESIMPGTNIGIYEWDDDISTVSLSNALFRYKNAIIENDSLYVDIYFLDTPKGKKYYEDLKAYTEVGITYPLIFRPAGQIDGGKIPARLEDENYTFLGIYATSKENDTLNYDIETDLTN